MQSNGEVWNGNETNEPTKQPTTGEKRLQMKQKDWDHIRMSPILLQQRENYLHINANTVEDIKNSSDEFLNVEFMHKMQNKT